MNIIMKKVEELIPYINNPRNNDDAVDAVASSIKNFGFKVPIVIDKNGEIVNGHTRLKASKKLGLKEVPCIVADDLTDEQIKAFRLADNKVSEIAEWDFELLEAELGLLDFDMEQFGFDMDEFDFDADGDEVVEDDFEIEETEEPKAKLGDIYQLGRHRLMCGDSTSDDVDVLMDGEKADMAFTDPPYNVQYTGGMQFKNGKVITNNRDMIKNDDVDLYKPVLYRLSENVNGPCYIWFADTKAKDLYEAAEMFGEIHALIIWVKNGGYGALNANYKQKHEPCLYWKPKGKKLNFIGATTETTIWEINKDGVNEFHPTQKPVSLATKAIKNHNAELVLDLFGGSGSTLIACEQLGRTCYIMELDPKYVDVIIKRWEQFTGQEAKLIKEEA